MGCGCHLFDVRKNEDDTPKMMNGVEENSTKSVTVTEEILLFLSLFGSHLLVFPICVQNYIISFIVVLVKSLK